MLAVVVRVGFTVFRGAELVGASVAVVVALVEVTDDVEVAFDVEAPLDELDALDDVVAVVEAGVRASSLPPEQPVRASVIANARPNNDRFMRSASPWCAPVRAIVES